MSLPTAILIFLTSSAIIGWSGTKLALYADRLADRTGWGEAVTGTVFLGFVTALPGLVAAITAAVEGYAELAIASAVGGIAIQTTFLALADITYTKANLEHAAASVTNMIQTATLFILLTLILIGLTGPDTSIKRIHPVTLILFLTAAGGFVLVYKANQEPMWNPKITTSTVKDIPEDLNIAANLLKLIIKFVIIAVMVSAAGAMVAHTAAIISEQTGLSETVTGGLFAGVATSLPELVTTVAAVRRRALTLAVGDIVGGNMFDVLFICAADIAFISGSIYHAPGMGKRTAFLTAVAILLNGILLLGMLFRQRRGPANIGFESVLILVFYITGFIIINLFM